jgi:hypothetical protein
MRVYFLEQKQRQSLNSLVMTPQRSISKPVIAQAPSPEPLYISIYKGFGLRVWLAGRVAQKVLPK